MVDDREKAIQNGCKRYSGNACKNCGETERYVINDNCRNCSNIRAKEYNRLVRKRIMDLRIDK